MNMPRETARASRRILVPGVTALALGLALTACGASNEGSGKGGTSGSTAPGPARRRPRWTPGGRLPDRQPRRDRQLRPVRLGRRSRAVHRRRRRLRRLRRLPHADEASRRRQEALRRRTRSRSRSTSARSPSSTTSTASTTSSSPPTTLAEIFAGKITTWNDPAIAADNPGAKLPETTITPVHRSDESGTTENFTDYLAQAARAAGPPGRTRPGRSRAVRAPTAPRAWSPR